ncbi:MAG: serine hydrolase domain-containing protein [Oscillospiraceae bacterium]
MYDKIYNAMKKAVDGGLAAGVNFLALKDGKEIAYCEYGFRDIEQQKPMTRDTIFRMYSSSKPITAAAVMLLVSRGLVDIAADISVYLPEFSDLHVNKDGRRIPAAGPITVKHLLNMTSGLPYPEENTAGGRQCGTVFWQLDNRLYGDHPMTTEEFSKLIAKNDLCFDPGEHFKYGVSADILGALIERVTGEKLSEFMQKELFEPLEMQDTGFYVPAGKLNRLAKAYDQVDGKLTEIKTNHLGIRYPADIPPAFESGGAGILSTLDDYSKFAGMLLANGSYKGKQIIPGRAVKYMTSGGLTDIQKLDMQKAWDYLYGYTYGNLMSVCEDESKSVVFASRGEYGWNGWLGTYFSNDPVNGITVLVGVQRVGAVSHTLARKLKNIIMCG